MFHGAAISSSCPFSLRTGKIKMKGNLSVHSRGKTKKNERLVKHSGLSVFFFFFLLHRDPF